jgi:hypothetical protein
MMSWGDSEIPRLEPGRVEIHAPPAEANRGLRSFATSIKQLFREVKQALTAAIDAAPEPKKRTRRGSGEAQSGFRLAARILCRIVRSIFHPGSLHWEPPCEFDDAYRQQLDWSNHASSYETDSFDSPAGASSNDLSPSP